MSDLAGAVRQSEPRVSRHLKILCDAGLLERMRQGQWVHYRVTREAAAAAFVQGLLGQVERNDPLYAQPRGVPRPAAGAPGGKTLESRLGRALKGFVEAVDMGSSGSAAGGGPAGGSPAASAAGGYEGRTHGQRSLLASSTWSCSRPRRSWQGGALRSRIRGGRRKARARLQSGTGLPVGFCWRSSPNALCEKDVDAAGPPFDVVFLDHVALPESALDGMLTYGRRALAPDGRLWVFERYEALAPRSSAPEGSREKILEHPIGRLRRLLGDVGLSCERLSPIEADGEHVIAAVAVPSRGVSRGTGAAGAA